MWKKLKINKWVFIKSNDQKIFSQNTGFYRILYVYKRKYNLLPSGKKMENLKKKN